MNDRLPDLQRPPETLPLGTPAILPIIPNDLPKWEARWKEFLFGDDLPPFSIGPKRLKIKQLAYKEGRRIERFRLQYFVEPGVKTEAFLLRPRHYRGKLPAIIFFHETYPLFDPWTAACSLDNEERADIVAELAQHNAVIIPRCFLFDGQRVPGEKPDFASAVAVMKKAHPRWKALGRMIRDGMRAVDVLLAQSYISRKSIGAIGHSLGAKEVLFLMAFDNRIKAGVASDGGIGLSFSNWDQPWFLGAELSVQGLENSQILAMIAPRSFLLVGGLHDNDRAWPFIAGAIPVWKSLGKLLNIGWYRHAAGHCLPLDARRVSYAFLGQQMR